MTRKFPVHHIHGTPFYVDVQLNEFREVGNVMNSISFDELLYKGDHYELLFDKDAKNIFDGDLDDVPGLSSVEYVKIPMMHELDPEGMEQRLQRNIDKSPQKDRGNHL